MKRKKKAAEVITEEEGRKRLERINREYEETRAEIEAEYAKPVPKHRNLWAHTLH